MDGLEIHTSHIHDRGVFATRGYRAGETVERCPVLVVPAAERHLIDRTHLHHYCFPWQDGAAAIALGFGSLYNHAAEPRARYRKDFGAGIVEIVAARDIPAGYEITVDYTEGGTEKLWFPQ
ncbi:SET domain-containing protein-lysine N-methyltransferase [Kitasatospora sp. NPDC088351]|uniref:SET domain-containing protein-lysine N-methyltransferase n=1 Tax=unclassified Kitasatospora TaxID=2633591 RepID=UPI0034303806